MQRPVLYTVPETLEILRCGRSLFYAMVKRGEIRLTKVAGKSLVKSADLDAFLASR